MSGDADFTRAGALCVAAGAMLLRNAGQIKASDALSELVEALYGQMSAEDKRHLLTAIEALPGAQVKLVVTPPKPRTPQECN